MLGILGKVVPNEWMSHLFFRVIWLWNSFLKPNLQSLRGRRMQKPLLAKSPRYIFFSIVISSCNISSWSTAQVTFLPFSFFWPLIGDEICFPNSTQSKSHFSNPRGFYAGNDFWWGNKIMLKREIQIGFMPKILRRKKM